MISVGLPGKGLTQGLQPPQLPKLQAVGPVTTRKTRANLTFPPNRNNHHSALAEGALTLNPKALNPNPKP